MTAPPSFTHRDLPGDVHLAVNSNKKMKTVLVVATLVANLDATVTRRAILPMILRRGTRSRSDMISINRYLEDLYGTALASSVLKVGEWHLIRFKLDVVNERFIPGESGILRKALEFLKELLWDPRVDDGAFHREFLDQERNNLKLSIETLVDQKETYASHRIVEEMCPTEPYRLHEYGRLEDIPEIGGEDLLAFHHDALDRQPLHLYLAGDLDVEATADEVASIFEPVIAGRSNGYPLNGVPEAVPVGEVREVVERMDVNQARLHLGFRHGITYADPRYTTLLVMNGILGAPGFSQSKLFQNVREKASLAYSVYSSLEKTKGLLFIASGIAAENHSKALDILLKQVRAVQSGDFTDEELRTTVAMILNSNEMLEDNLRALADVEFTWRLHGVDFDFREFREQVERVDRDAVVDVARCLQHDTDYLLCR